MLASTNERAKDLAREGAPHGTVVTADEQTAGRGRQGTTWVAPPRAALLMSLVVRDLGNREALLTLTAWRRRDALRGNRVQWARGEGVAAGINETGALLVDTSAGQVALDAGEVHLKRA